MSLPPVLLPTTVVGSYPPVEGRGFRSLLDRHRTALETAVADQRRAGIEIISDGQVRADMVSAFADRLPGVREGRVIGRIGLPAHSITVEDVRYARSKAPYVKGILTGPTTLAHALHLDTHLYRDREEVALDLAAVLAQEARALVEAGVCMLQIDEPILSTGAADPAAAGGAVALVAEGLPVPVALHACGPVEGMIDALLRYPVQILDLEFAGHPGNLEVLAARDLGEKADRPRRRRLVLGRGRERRDHPRPGRARRRGLRPRTAPDRPRLRPPYAFARGRVRQALAHGRGRQEVRDGL